MKIHNTLNSAGKNSASTAQRAIQSRAHGGKPSAHRYERRKVREYLRHAVALAGGVIDFAYPATGGTVPTAKFTGAHRSTGGSLKQNRKLRDCEITVRDGE